VKLRIGIMELAVYGRGRIAIPQPQAR
jgi:hypothetical protein